jgi:ribonuclease Z
MNRILKWGLIALGAVAVIVAGGAFAAFQVSAVQDALLERTVRSTLLKDRSTLLKDDALRAVVCGSASPMPDPNRAKACIAVFAAGKMYVVDTGPQSAGKLALWRLPVWHIGGVLYTHFHSDHIGDLGELNMNSWMQGRDKLLDVYGPPGVERVVAGFAEAYALDKGYRVEHHGTDVASPDNWTMVAHPVALDGATTPERNRTGLVLQEGDLKITAIELNHVPVEPAYAYRFDYKGRSLVISGDTIAHKPLAVAAKDADVVFYEAQGKAMVERLRALLEETGNNRLAKIMNDTQSYHTSPTEAATLLKDANVKLLVFYHYTPAVPNVIAEKILTRGVSDIRPSDWLVSRDGTMVELPVGSTQVRVGDIADN